MIKAFAICLALAALEPTVAQTHRFQTCMAVGMVAEREGVDPSLAVALAWHESSMLTSLVSRAGAVGPLQVVPRWGCPGGQKDGCDLIGAGVRMLKMWQRHTRGDDRMAVAHYNGGRKPGKSSVRWARWVIITRDKLQRSYVNED